MIKLFNFEGTISGKTVLLRYLFSVFIFLFVSYLVMPNEYWIVEEYNSRYLFEENKFLDLFKHLCLTILLLIFHLSTMEKRFNAFNHSKNLFGTYLYKYKSELVNMFGFLTFLFEIKNWGGLQTVILIMYFLLFFVFALIPAFMNSPITNYKSHKGWNF